ncbi:MULTISPECIES: MarR family winged helix-turn-helix transcriptional regulator [unclassified Plantibacter]|jgi:DNA-binding MarR family transcriptional regulator|uniref:MarR family winged helix-turn-helix transcriptional regulator n=1 Tax=unclassified Plantibacter TaxID=2624265 RepID=UPI003D34FA29
MDAAGSAFDAQGDASDDERREAMTEQRDPMTEWPTGRLLSMASRLVEHTWLRALEQIGVTHAGLIVLHLLDDGPTSQKELARRARVQNQTMSRTLDRLERDGLVQRVADPHDRRRHVVSRTDDGKRVWKTADRLEADVFPTITDHEVLRGVLLEIIRSGESARWSEEQPAPE